MAWFPWLFLFGPKNAIYRNGPVGNLENWFNYPKYWISPSGDLPSKRTNQCGKPTMCRSFLGFPQGVFHIFVNVFRKGKSTWNHPKIIVKPPWTQMGKQPLTAPGPCRAEDLRSARLRSWIRWKASAIRTWSWPRLGDEIGLKSTKVTVRFPYIRCYPLVI